MCGIAGIVGSPSLPILNNMLHRQRHRGPDNTGTWHDEHVALGHNRLSIIDLSAAGHQPMEDATGRYMIIFNGEVYNYIELKETFVPDYHYRSVSDTEVLLAMYDKMGSAMLQHLIGMFALAIWDKQEKKLFAARDRFGVKPLYYAHHNGSLYFSSELKTLWEAGVPKQTNDAVWASFLSTGNYGLPDQTFWQHIHALPAGHFMFVNKHGETNVQQWYNFTDAIAKQTVFDDTVELQQAYEALMLDAVKLRFRADVPVGFNLSGGLDSSTLLATVQRIYPDNNKIKGYSFYCNDDRYDELPWVQQLIAQTGKPLEAVLLDVQEAAAAAEAMAAAQDEPYGGIPTIAYSHIFKAARRQNTIVLLDGQGMDEAWGGYDYYYKAGGGIVQGTSQSPVALDALDSHFVAASQPIEYATPFNNRLQNLQYRDIFYTKIPRALRFNDRASMLYSTELREPFLDHRLVEMAFAQPESVKMKDGQTKWMLRNMATQWLGNTLALAPKRPLQTPQREWLRGELKDWASAHIEWLAGPGNPGWFNAEALLNKWQAYLAGESDNSFYVWQWINTAMLLRVNGS